MSDLTKALVLLALVFAGFSIWRAVSFTQCKAACAQDCEAFAERTNPFGGRNPMGLGLCEQGVRLCEDRCTFF